MKTIPNVASQTPQQNAQNASLKASDKHVADFKIRLELGRRRITQDEAARIEPGSVIELDSLVSDSVDVYVDGELFARGEAVVVDMAGEQGPKRLGVVVQEIVAGLNRQTLGHYQAEASVHGEAKCQAGGASSLKGAIAVALLSLALVCAPASAQLRGQGESKETQRVSSSANGKGANDASNSKSGGWQQMGQTAVALIVVIGLIFATRLVLKRLGGRRGMSAEGGLIDVLARAPLGHKHQLALVRLGGRLVLVGVSPDGLCRLGEITEPTEVASLISQAESAQRNLLKNLFKPAQTPRGAAEVKSACNIVQGDEHQTLRGLTDRLRERAGGRESK